MIVFGIFVCLSIIYHTESTKVSVLKDSDGERNTCVHVVVNGQAAENILQVLSEISGGNKKCKIRGRYISLKRFSSSGDVYQELDIGCPRTVEIWIKTNALPESIKYSPMGQQGFEVFCEMKKDGGGWTVIQRRKDGTVNFYRGWNAYRRGFGSVNEEYWLGNDYIHQITSQGSFSLRIDLEDFNHNHAFAKYSMFSVESGRNRYKLHVGGYSGNAGDGLHYHNGRPFSTKDQDNDSNGRKHCAQSYKGGWCYGSCHQSNLNGLYHRGRHASIGDGVNWNHWKGHNYSLKTSIMMIKRN